MSYPFGAAGWPTLAQLIGIFVNMGCTVSDALIPVEGSDEKRLVRFLYNQETEGFVSLRGYEDNDFIPPSEVANWERRLGLEIPKRDSWH